MRHTALAFGLIPIPVIANVYGIDFAMKQGDESVAVLISRLADGTLRVEDYANITGMTEIQARMVARMLTDKHVYKDASISINGVPVAGVASITIE